MAAHVHLNYLLLTCENRTPEPQQQQQSFQPTVAGLRKQLDVLLKLQTVISGARVSSLSCADGDHYQLPEFGPSCRRDNRGARARLEDAAAEVAGGGRRIGGDAGRCVAGIRRKDVRIFTRALEISPCIHYD